MFSLCLSSVGIYGSSTYEGGFHSPWPVGGASFMCQGMSAPSQRHSAETLLLRWESYKDILHQSPQGDHSPLTTAVICLVRHTLWLPLFLVSLPSPLSVFPGITSQINYFHSIHVSLPKIVFRLLSSIFSASLNFTQVLNFIHNAFLKTCSS